MWELDVHHSDEANIYVVYASAEAAKEAVPFTCSHCHSEGIIFRRQYKGALKDIGGIQVFHYRCIKCNKLIKKEIRHYGAPHIWEKEGWR